MKDISNNVLQFANKRGLSQKTLTDLRIESGQGQYGKDKLEEYFFEILPDYDEDRVYPSDIKKIVQWYNLLTKNGISQFKNESSEEEE